MSLQVDIEKRLGDFTLRARFETEGTMALLGASGSGKSVTLRCIAGILTPDRGRIALDGNVLFDSERHIDLPPQRRRVGYLFQQYALFPTMTVEKNVRCAVRAEDKHTREEKTAALLRRFRLTGLEKKYPAQLSGGEQQRAALARIMASEPRVILLDEPFSALDSCLRWDLEQELSELLAPFAAPIVWVSHDLGECRRNCETVCVVEHGITGEVTTMEALLHHPATMSQARLAGCRCFLPVRRCDGGVLLEDWGIVLPLSLCAGRATLALPDGAVVPGGAHPARIHRVIHDLNGDIALLLPKNACEHAVALRTILPSGSGMQSGECMNFDLDPARCYLYE